MARFIGITISGRPHHVLSATQIAHSNSQFCIGAHEGRIMTKIQIRDKLGVVPRSAIIIVSRIRAHVCVRLCIKIIGLLRYRELWKIQRVFPMQYKHCPFVSCHSAHALSHIIITITNACNSIALARYTQCTVLLHNVTR